MVLKLAQMQEDVKQLRAAQLSHEGSIKTLFLCAGESDYAVERLQAKVEEHSSMLSLYQQTCSTVLTGFSDALRSISQLCFVKKQ